MQIVSEDEAAENVSSYPKAAKPVGQSTKERSVPKPSAKLPQRKREKSQLAGLKDDGAPPREESHAVLPPNADSTSVSKHSSHASKSSDLKDDMDSQNSRRSQDAQSVPNTGTVVPPKDSKPTTSVSLSSDRLKHAHERKHEAADPSARNHATHSRRSNSDAAVSNNITTELPKIPQHTAPSSLSSKHPNQDQQHAASGPSDFTKRATHSAHEEPQVDVVRSLMDRLKTERAKTKSTLADEFAQRRSHSAKSAPVSSTREPEPSLPPTRSLLNVRQKKSMLPDEFSGRLQPAKSAPVSTQGLSCPSHPPTDSRYGVRQSQSASRDFTDSNRSDFDQKSSLVNEVTRRLQETGSTTTPASVSSMTLKTALPPAPPPSLASDTSEAIQGPYPILPDVSFTQASIDHIDQAVPRSQASVFGSKHSSTRSQLQQIAEGQKFTSEKALSAQSATQNSTVQDVPHSQSSVSAPKHSSTGSQFQLPADGWKLPREEMCQLSALSGHEHISSSGSSKPSSEYAHPHPEARSSKLMESQSADACAGAPRIPEATPVRDITSLSQMAADYSFLAPGYVDPDLKSSYTPLAISTFDDKNASQANSDDTREPKDVISRVLRDKNQMANAAEKRRSGVGNSTQNPLADTLHKSSAEKGVTDLAAEKSVTDLATEKGVTNLAAEKGVASQSARGCDDDNFAVPSVPRAKATASSRSRDALRQVVEDAAKPKTRERRLSRVETQIERALVLLTKSSSLEEVTNACKILGAF